MPLMNQALWRAIIPCQMHGLTPLFSLVLPNAGHEVLPFFVLQKEEAHSPIPLAAVQALNNDNLCHKRASK